MMNEEKVTELDQFDLPYGRKVNLKNVEYENGMRLLRLTFRENRRFTILDIDADRAECLGLALSNWAKNNSEQSKE